MSQDSVSTARHSRKGLFGPLIVLGLLIAAWTGWWFYLAGQVETRLAAQVEGLRRQGWDIRYQADGVSGWPFRVRLGLDQAVIGAPSGHAVSAPRLVAEANAYDPTHWVVLAPDGATLTRAAGKGQVGVTGEAIRMSVSGLNRRWPRLAIELAGPVFTARGDAEAFPISRAERIALEVRPHAAEGENKGGDDIDLLFQMADAQGRMGGPVEGLAQQGRLSARIETVIEDADQLKGMDTAGVFAAWSRAGGRFTGVRGQLQAGESRATLTSDALAAGPDGRLEGQLALRAEKPLPAIAGLARSGSGAVNRMGAAGAAAATAAGGGQGDIDLTLVFRDGRTFLGPFALAPAPKLF
jgi:hypothetical protein